MVEGVSGDGDTEQHALLVARLFGCDTQRTSHVPIEELVHTATRGESISALLFAEWRLALEQRHERAARCAMIVESVEVEWILRLHLQPQYEHDKAVANLQAALGDRREILFVMATSASGSHFFAGHVRLDDERTVTLYDSLESYTQEPRAPFGDRSLNRVQPALRTRIQRALAFFARLGDFESFAPDSVRFGACHQQASGSNDCAAYSWAVIELLVQGEPVLSDAMPHGDRRDAMADALRQRLAHQVLLGSPDSPLPSLPDAL